MEPPFPRAVQPTTAQPRALSLPPPFPGRSVQARAADRRRSDRPFPDPVAQPAAAAAPKTLCFFTKDLSAAAKQVIKNRGYVSVQADAKGGTLYDALASAGTIDNLIVATHGDEKGPEIADGKGDVDPAELGGKLKAHLSGAGAIYFASCNVAKDGGGYIKAVAKAADCPVYAPTKYCSWRVGGSCQIWTHADGDDKDVGVWLVAPKGGASVGEIPDRLKYKLVLP
jgi:hypothetical protein